MIKKQLREKQFSFEKHSHIKYEEHEFLLDTSQNPIRYAHILFV